VLSCHHLPNLIPQLEQSLLRQSCPPPCLVVWTQAITKTLCDPIPDEFAILRARAACLWSQLGGNLTPNHALVDAATALEDDLDAWAEAVMRPQASSHQHRSHSELGPGTTVPSERRMWIDWNICRVIAARSPKSVIGHRSSPEADMTTLSSIRRHMISLVHANDEFGLEGNIHREQSFESVISASYWVIPLYFAGLCVIDEYRDTVSRKASRQVDVYALANYLCSEMDWIRSQLACIATKLGDHHANEVLTILSTMWI
jgi:hypothetical protein